MVKVDKTINFGDMIHVFLVVFLAGGVYYTLTDHIEKPHHDNSQISQLTIAVNRLLLVSERNVADIEREGNHIEAVKERVRQLEINQGKK